MGPRDSNQGNDRALQTDLGVMPTGDCQIRRQTSR